MTLDEVIKRFSDNAEYERSHGNLQGCLEFRQLAEWLTELKELKEQMEPCEDCISRQVVLDTIDSYMSHHMGFLDLKLFVTELPPVQPKQKTGHWVKYGSPRCGEQHYKCTSCGYYINFGKWGELYTKEFKYCPNCMAKMVEPQKSEE